jgi:hypothetical protein
MAMVLLRALDHPFTCDDIGAGLGLSAAPEFQMVGLVEILDPLWNAGHDGFFSER